MGRQILVAVVYQWYDELLVEAMVTEPHAERAGNQPSTSPPNGTVTGVRWPPSGAVKVQAQNRLGKTHPG
jgi:hypothetical protein